MGNRSKVEAARAVEGPGRVPAAVAELTSGRGPGRPSLTVGAAQPLAELLHLQRTIGNRASRLVSPPGPVATTNRSGREVISRYLDADDKLPDEEQTFEGWIDVYWDEPDWITPERYDEVELLYDDIVQAQGDKFTAQLAYDVAFYTWNAHYLAAGSDARNRAVAAAADTFDGTAPPTEDTARATWPGRDPAAVPDDYVTAVIDEVARRAAEKLRADADAKETARQQQAAAAKAIRDRQTRRDWTARQVIRMCGYGGKTSVHPYWGGRILMINQRTGFHFTLFQDCYTPAQAFPSGTDIQTVITSIFGGTGGQNCLHVTQEMFGPKDARNPHYFFSGAHKPADPGTTKVVEMSQQKLRTLMDEEKARISTLLRVDQNM